MRAPIPIFLIVENISDNIVGNVENATPENIMRKRQHQESIATGTVKANNEKQGKNPGMTEEKHREHQTAKREDTDLVALGERLRSIRNGRGLTLAEAARLTGTGASSLSKIETGQMSPTYDMLQKIVRGLEIDLVDLFDTRKHELPRGRRDITRAGAGRLHKTPRYEHELLATELAHKKFYPFKSRIAAREPILQTLDDGASASSHAGEEFLYVLSGAVELHTDAYAPVRLEAGDSVYFDSGMRHAVISVSEEDAFVLWVASQV
jgi:transcriptional regulator with XRE-family HTH domain